MMNTLHKTLFGLLLLLSTSAPNYAQESVNEWSPYFEDERILLELAQAHRADSVNGIYNNYVLIRITNKTQHRVSVDFDKQLHYNQQPVSTDPIASLQLESGAVLTGSTEPGTNKSLRIFVNQEKGLNKKVLTDYALINIHSQTITH